MCRSYYLPTDSERKPQADILGVVDLPEHLRPTQAEKDHLESCVKWKICTVCMPIGILCGMIGFLGAVNGMFLHPRYGAGPATVGTGFIAAGLAGYLVQEMCVKETIAKFPEGNGRFLRPDLVPKDPSAVVE